MDWIRKGEWLEIRLGRAEAPVNEQAAGTEAETRQWLEQWLREKGITPKRAAQLVREKQAALDGTRLRLRAFPPEEAGFAPDWQEPDVLYEDDFCLVVNKPAGMAVHPSNPDQTGTLAHAVAGYYLSTGQACAVRHIHRLDEDTTGPVLYAKNSFAHSILDADMREKAIERIYLAVVWGSFARSRGTVDEPIGRDRHHKSRRRVSQGGDEAVTHYEVLRQKGGTAAVSLRLETGRTHQIRVHMSYIGHPLVGDALYGGKPLSGMARQALHGSALIFLHPLTKERICITAPLPPDLSELLDALHLSSIDS